MTEIFFENKNKIILEKENKKLFILPIISSSDFLSVVVFACKIFFSKIFRVFFLFQLLIVCELSAVKRVNFCIALQSSTDSLVMLLKQTENQSTKNIIQIRAQLVVFIRK